MNRAKGLGITIGWLLVFTFYGALFVGAIRIANATLRHESATTQDARR